MTLQIVSGISKPATTPPLSVYIRLKAKTLMDTYVDSIDKEISGLGTVTIFGPNALLIDEIYLLRQKVSSGETIMDPQGMAAFARELRSAGGDVNKIRLWWHSHHASSVFWSSQTDLKTIESFGAQGATWMVSLVTNKSGEYLTRVDIYDPLRVVLDGLSLVTVADTDEALMERVKAEIATKVEVMSIPVVKIYSKRKRGRKK